MSYSCVFSFKKMEPIEIMPFLVSFKHACTEHLKDIAESEFWRCTFNVDFKPLQETFSALTTTERATAQAWAHEYVFKFKYFYNPELKLLGMSGVYKPLQYLFDGTVHFQNATDRDYKREEYDGVKEFEDIYAKWMTMSYSDFNKEYQKRNGKSFDDLIELDYPECIGNEMKMDKIMEYHKRTYCYDEAWSHFSQHLFDDEDQIFFSVYCNNERQEIMRFVKYCYDAQIEANKQENW